MDKYHRRKENQYMIGKAYSDLSIAKKKAVRIDLKKVKREQAELFDCMKEVIKSGCNVGVIELLEAHNFANGDYVQVYYALQEASRREIMVMMNISLNGVRIARNRVRNKLSIPLGTTIKNYVKSM